MKHASKSSSVKGCKCGKVYLNLPPESAIPDFEKQEFGFICDDCASVLAWPFDHKSMLAKLKFDLKNIKKLAVDLNEYL